MGGGVFWMELYATSFIPDLSVYTVRTKQDYVLPGDTIQAGEYVMVSDVGFDLATFAETTFQHLYVSSKVDLDHGDDPVYIVNDGIVEDQMGTGGPGDGSGEPWKYKFGFIRRKPDVPPGTSFDFNDWYLVTSAPLLKNCAVNSDCGVNAYPFLEYKCEYFTFCHY